MTGSGPKLGYGMRPRPGGRVVITRRSFVAALGGLSFSLAGRVDRLSGQRGFHPDDPRLTARPRRPFRPVEVGQTPIGEHLERGGLLYVPTSYRADAPAPLLVALHGGGGDADRWSSLFSACDRHGMVLAAPDSRGRTWDRAHGDFGPDVAFIDAVLRFTFERCAIDDTRIALAGFSDGASYALSLGPSNGDLFTHLIAWSPGFSNPAEPIVGRPRVLISHGAEDDVLPVGVSRSAIAPMFEMDGYDTTYLEFEGRHELTDAVVEESFEWFLG